MRYPDARLIHAVSCDHRTGCRCFPEEQLRYIIELSAERNVPMCRGE